MGTRRVLGHAPPEKFGNLDTLRTFLMHSDTWLIQLTMIIIMVNIIYTSSVKCQLSTELNYRKSAYQLSAYSLRMVDG